MTGSFLSFIGLLALLALGFGAAIGLVYSICQTSENTGAINKLRSDLLEVEEKVHRKRR